MHRAQLVAALLLGLLPHRAWSGGRDLAKDPGFEQLEGAWTRYSRRADAFVPDKGIKRSGEQSIRCHNATAQGAAGAVQAIVCDQESIVPLYIRGYSRAEGVSGATDQHYGLWLDIEYVDDTRPGRVDDWVQLPFAAGTHGWQKVEATFTPKRPVRRFNLYALFRRHRGTVWFDDVQVTQLSATRLSGAARDFAAPPATLVPPRFTDAVARAKPDEMVVLVRKERLRDYHLDDLAVYLDGACLKGGRDGVLWRGEPDFASAPSTPTPAGPGLWVALRPARWEERLVELTAVGKRGNAYRCLVALPSGVILRRAQFANWEPSFDSASVYRLGDRVLLANLFEVMSGSDVCRWAVLDKARRAVAPIPPRDKASETRLSAGEHLTLHFSRDGALAAMTVQGRELCLAPGSGGKSGWLSGEAGLYVGDWFAGKLLCVKGGISANETGAGVRQQAVVDELKLRVDVAYRARADAVLVEGEVADLSGRERAIDIAIKLPLRARGDTVVWHDLTTCARLADVRRVAMQRYPWLAVVAGGGEYGLALGISGEYPARQQILYEPEGGLLHARVKFAIIHDAKPRLKGKVPFGFIVMPVDPKWGFRDAARRYYKAYPRLFHCRPHREGMWMFGRLKGTQVPNPGDFSYFEGPRRLRGYLREAGVLAAPYIIPNQRSITRLARLPADYGEAMQMLAEYDPSRKGWGGKGTREIIGNAAILDPTGKHPIRIRDDVGADRKPDPPIFNVVFPVNPDPDLASGAEEMNRIREWVDEPSLGAVYTDSGSAWSARYLNVRRDHFRYADLPLTYDEQAGQPAILGKAPPVEHWRTMGAILHRAGKLVFANLGHQYADMWSYFAVDICGCEQGSSRDDFLNYSRTLACRKPVLFLGYLKLHGKPTPLMEREGFERHVKRCAMMGIYPSIAIRPEYPDFYQRCGDLYRLYIPIIRTLSSAGWQPVTHATIPEAPRVRVERFGPSGDAVYFTVYNGSGQGLDVALNPDLPALGATGISAVRDLVARERLEAAPRLRMHLDPAQLRVLAMQLAK